MMSCEIAPAVARPRETGGVAFPWSAQLCRLWPSPPRLCGQSCRKCLKTWTSKKKKKCALMYVCLWCNVVGPENLDYVPGKSRRCLRNGASRHAHVLVYRHVCAQVGAYVHIDSHRHACWCTLFHMLNVALWCSASYLTSQCLSFLSEMEIMIAAGSWSCCEPPSPHTHMNDIFTYVYLFNDCLPPRLLISPDHSRSWVSIWWVRK